MSNYHSIVKKNVNDLTEITGIRDTDKLLVSHNGELKVVTFETASLSSKTARLLITAPEGSSITITDDDGITVNIGQDYYVYDVPHLGDWYVTATRDDKTKTRWINVIDNSDYDVLLSFANIYGIQRDQTSSSPEWTRINSGIGKTAAASVGNVTVGHSDFDELYPWSEMKRVTFGTGDVMVYIPEFYYFRDVTEGLETIQISDQPFEGFEKHPGSGKYVSAYFGVGSGNKSVSGQQNSQSFSLNSMRTTAAAKGLGWQTFDAAAWSAIQMLILVEFATNDVQTAIGVGDHDQAQTNSTRFNYWSTGACDNMTYQTGVAADGYTVIYRGIEGLWGLAWIGIDGVLINGGSSIYVATDPSKFGSSTLSDYTQLSYTTPITTAWAPVKFGAKCGYDPAMPWVMIPSSYTNGSATTGLCDCMYTESGQTVPLVGGASDDTEYHNGIFCIANVPATKDVRHHGIRYVYDPSLDPQNTAGVPAAEGGES